MDNETCSYFGRKKQDEKFMLTESLRNKALKGVMWSAVERFSVQGLQFALSIIIARLVSPSDFGLIAMLSVFIAISQTFVDSGFSNALIQKKDRTEVDFSTVFYFNIVVSLIVYYILFLIAPFISSFYDEPQLDIICKFTGLSIIVSSFSIVQRTKLNITLNYKLQAKISFIAVFFSGIIGVMLAWKGYGVWALVIQTLLNKFIETFLFWIIVRWTPSKTFSISSFRLLFAFGSKILAGALLATLCSNMYNLVIGKKYDPVNVGYFTRSYSLASFPSDNIGTIISRVTYPILCSVQDDQNKLNEILLKYVSMTAYLLFPLMVGVSVLSKPLIICLLTEKWLPVADLLTIICIASMWHPISYINWQMLNVKGRSDLSLKTEIIKRIFQFLILLITIDFGIKMIAVGLLIYYVIEFVVILYFLRSIFEIRFFDIIQGIYPAIYLSAIMGVCLYLCTLLNIQNFIKVLFSCILGVISYILFFEITKNKNYCIIKNIIKQQYEIIKKNE